MTRDDFIEKSGVSRETADRFNAWRALLEETNAHTNLVGRSTLPDFWERHAYDSFQLFQYLPKDTRKIVDLGAGAGFPGLALALGFLDRGIDGRVVMVDSVAKKMAFVKQAIRATAAPAETRAVRVESLDPGEGFDVITARAFAPLHKLLGYAEPLLKNGAVALVLKGRNYADELTEARKSWTFDLEVYPSETSDGVILQIQEVERVTSR